MSLTIKVGKFRDIPVVRLVGRVIGVDSKKLRRKIEAQFMKKSDRIIIEISGIEFIDSYGLGVIVYYHTCMQKVGRELILFNKNPNPQAYMTRLLELTRLENVFKVISSPDDL